MTVRLNNAAAACKQRPAAAGTIIFIIIFILSLISDCLPVYRWFVKRAGAAEVVPHKFLLDVTSLKTSEFPLIDMKVFFRNENNVSENGLSTAHFSLSENFVSQTINMTRIFKTVSAAVIIDSSMNGVRSGLSHKLIEHASNYLEALDKIAVFTFCPEMRVIDFTGDRQLISASAIDREIDYNRTADELILYAAEKLCGQIGGKHIIYITSEPFFINESVCERIRAMSEENRPSLHFLKLKDPKSGLDRDFFSSTATVAAVSTGGIYREEFFKDAVSGIAAIMRYIKSNYQIDYTSTQPYYNGRQRNVNLNADYLNTITGCQVNYCINFNLPQLNFGFGDNPVFYQELDPQTFSKAVSMGLSLSASVKFMEHKNVKTSGALINAFIGFGAFRVNGQPEELDHYIVKIDDKFDLSAARYRFNNIFDENYMKRHLQYIDNKEKIDLKYSERKFLKSSSNNTVIKKAGIYWTPFLRDGSYDQWVRVFISFIPDELVFDGTRRYAVYVGGLSTDGIEREIIFDGIQLQYGLAPTIFTETKTIYLGPQDVNKPMVQPLNPRLEYQMK